MQLESDNLINHLSFLINISPEDEELYFLRADRYFDLEQYDFALKDYFTSYELGNNTAEVVYLIGLCQDRLGNLDIAKRQYLICLLLDPSYTRARNNLGLIYLGKQNLKDAEDCFSYILQNDPYHFRSRNNMALIYAIQGKYIEAVTMLTLAISINKDYDKAHVNRAHALIELGEYDSALSDLELVINSLNSLNYEAYHYKGVLLKNRKQYNEAVENFIKAINLNEKSVRSHIEIGEIALIVGMEEQAIQAFKIAIAIDKIYSILIKDILNKYNNKSGRNRFGGEKIKMKSQLEDTFHISARMSVHMITELKTTIRKFILAESETEIIDHLEVNNETLKMLVNAKILEQIIQNSSQIEDRLKRNYTWLVNNLR